MRDCLSCEAFWYNGCDSPTHSRNFFEDKGTCGRLCEMPPASLTGAIAFFAVSVRRKSASPGRCLDAFDVERRQEVCQTALQPFQRFFFNASVGGRRNAFR